MRIQIAGVTPGEKPLIEAATAGHKPELEFADTAKPGDVALTIEPGNADMPGAAYDVAQRIYCALNRERGVVCDVSGRPDIHPITLPPYTGFAG